MVSPLFDASMVLFEDKFLNGDTRQGGANEVRLKNGDGSFVGRSAGRCFVD